MIKSSSSVLTGYLAGDAARPQDASGDFVVGSRHPTQGWAASSVIGALPWYYTVSPLGELLQGSNVFELCATAKHPWHWNLTAVSQIAMVGHTLGSHTLHPKIFRLAAHTEVRLVNGAAKLTKTDSLSAWRWDEFELDDSFKTLTDAFSACLESSRAPILSLSAGYDSRVLLALCLQAGCSPTIASMGSAEAADFKVAKLLAQRVGLAVEQIELSPDDYLKHGEQISRTTSGVKTAGDWHTWLYSKRIENPDCIHLVGSNGEFARTFFSDVLTRSKLFRLSGRRGVTAWLALKTLNRFRKLPRNFWFANPVRFGLVFDSLQLPSDEYPNSTVACLDTFYAIERVHHFIGSGMACYAQFSKPRSPFLDKRWMKEIAALRRPWKEGNRYHVAAVKKFAPYLLDIPFNQDPDGAKLISYSPFSKLSHSQEVEQLLVESSALDFLLDRNARIRAMRDPRADKLAAVSFLLTMHFAGMNTQNLKI